MTTEFGFCHERAVYIDLEWNCWDSAKHTTQHREIIEIGAVEMDLTTLQVVKEMDYLVRPRPFDISERCTAITGLTPQDLKKAPSFPAVLEKFERDFSPREKICCAWGRDDDALKEACERYKLRSPLRNRIDIAQLFWHVFLLKSQPSLRRAMEIVGIEFDGVAHTALADARNTSRVHGALIRRIRAAPGVVVLRDPCPLERERGASVFGEKLSRALSRIP